MEKEISRKQALENKGERRGKEDPTDLGRSCSRKGGIWLGKEQMKAKRVGLLS